MRQYHVIRGKYMVADSLIKGTEKEAEVKQDTKTQKRKEERRGTDKDEIRV